MTIKISQLKEAIKEMTINEMDWNTIDVSLNILETAITTEAFVSFCEELEELV
jgi:hypothetical protein